MKLIKVSAPFKRGFQKRVELANFKKYMQSACNLHRVAPLQRYHIILEGHTAIQFGLPF